MSEESINTFAVIDLETNGLPSEQFNQCSITELSVYAFSAKCLLDKEDRNCSSIENDIDGIESYDHKPPELPRVLHKLTMMINPKKMIYPIAERVTGLSNDMLCKEAPFDKNTADCLLSFMERLEKPICLVAHNGWTFDYPVIRHVLEKINMSLPSYIFCVDSLMAFREIDEKKVQIENAKKDLQENEGEELGLNQVATAAQVTETTRTATITSDHLDENNLINMQQTNETTPHRKKRNFSAEEVSHSSSSSSSLAPKQRRLDSNFTPKNKYPKKGVYKLGNIYERIFRVAAENLHRAESDVAILTKLILHYGLDFLAYAEERKLSFNQVPKLGSNDN